MNLFTLNESASLGRTTQDTLSITIDFDAAQLGGVELQTEKAIRHVIGLARPEHNAEPIEWSEWDETIRRYSDQILQADSTGKQHDLYLLFVSGFIHEMRHAHDLLASCYGQDFLFLALNCYQNVPALLENLKLWQVSQKKAIPVPLPIEFEVLSPDSQRIVKRYREIIESMRQAQLPLGSPSWLTPIDILETSACNAQLGFLNEVFGPEHTFRVAQYIALSPTANKYLRARNSVADYLSSRGFNKGVMNEALNYLVWASLMLLVPKDRSKAKGLNPSIAFEAFVEQLGRKQHKLGVEEAAEAVVAFCEAWGLKTPKEMGSHFQDLTRQRLDSIPVNSLKVIRESHIGLSESFVRMQQFIEQHPASYFNSGAYSWGIIGGNFPAVLVRTRAARRMDDFVSPGMPTLSYENLGFMDAMGCTLRVLCEGFGALGDDELESMIFDLLRNSSDHSFDFKDTFF